MVFKVPRFEDWRGGYGILGLGDLVLPGLLVVFALRYDCMSGSKNKRCATALPPPRPHRLQSTHQLTPSRRPPTRSYYALCCCGYVVGLLCAFLANGLGLTVFGVQGQPVRPQRCGRGRGPRLTRVRPQALLYLVPLTLGPLVVRAWARGELGDMMRGPACFVDPHASAHRGEEGEGGSSGAEEGGEGAAGEGRVVGGEGGWSPSRRDVERGDGEGASAGASPVVASAAALGAVSGRASRSPEQLGPSRGTATQQVELGRVRPVRRLSSESTRRGQGRESPIQQAFSSAVRAMREASEGSGEQPRRSTEEEAQLLDRDGGGDERDVE